MHFKRTNIIRIIAIVSEIIDQQYHEVLTLLSFFLIICRILKRS